MIKRKKAFTLLEVMLAVLILAILSAASVAGYRGYRDRAAMLVDDTNMKILAAASKLYAYDNNALPGSISQLHHRDMERAYALVTSGKQRYTMLAHLKEVFRESVAEAVPLPQRYYNNDSSVLACPLDEAADRRLGKSYAFAAGVANQPLSWLLDVRNANVTLITEVGGTTGVAFRHRGGTTAVEITVGGEKIRKRGNSNPSSGLSIQDHQ